MSRNKEKKKQDPGITLLDLVIVVLIFVMIYNGFTAWFYKSRTERRSFSQEASMLAFDIERGDYVSLIQGKYINKFNGETEASEYYALADYIEAVSVYKVYAAKGYTDRASKQRKIMDKSRKEMGDLTVFADKADKMFGF